MQNDRVPPLPVIPHEQREKSAHIERLAACVVERVLSVYREDYIERMDRDEPDSLLGLVKQLQRALG